MLDYGLNEQQHRYAETIFQSSDILLTLINDILDYSKTEAGKISLEHAPFDLLRVVEDVAELLAPRALEKMIDIMVRYAPGTPRFVIGDSARIRQVLCNLIGNAVKFTETGYVLTTIELIDGETNAGDGLSFKISIRDTGIGIATEKLDHIFERFAQADGSTTRKYGGTGLGLSISRNLVELMGGTIAVDSIVGEGTTFSFTFVLKPDASLRDAEPDHSFLRGAKVLVVDDLEVNRSILCEQLSIAGVACRAVESARDAFRALREAHSQEQPFEFAIIDYMMPEENGVQLAERIGSNSDLSQTTLIMLSSADPSEGRTAKISAYLTKPVRQMQLFDVLAALQTAKVQGQSIDQVRKFATGSSSPERQAETALAGLRVLLVEDNRVNRELAKANLTNLSCDVAVAEDGKEAVAQVMERTFDVILMDCQMPVMDGFEASRIISTMIANKELQPTPIIALTANAMPGDRERCLEAGMDDYVTKPLRKKTLIDVLTRWRVSKKHQDLPARRPEMSEAEITQPTESVI
jgi:CheY-like chemotaxis protein